jgi:hypothetical protein
MPKFYPRLSKLISFEKLPTIFSGLNDIFDKLYFRNFQTIKSIDGVSVSYVIEIISYKELKIDIAGSGFSLLLNPDFESDGASAFPLSLNTRWGIRKYIKNFNIAFGESSQEFFDTFFEVVTMEDSELIMAASLVFIDDTEDLLTAFLNDFNDFYTTSYTLTDSSDFEGSIEEILTAFTTENKNVRLFVFNKYINDSELVVALDNVRKLFSFKTGGDPIAQLKDLIIPYASARILLSGGLEIPRSILLPMKLVGDKYVVEENTEINTILMFGESEISFDTTTGISIDYDIVLNFHPLYPKAQIGNTGFTINITNAKIDLSNSTNIPEADAEERPNSFKGVFIEEISIGLPPGWTSGPSNVEIIGRDLLIGTGGGFSGKIGVEGNGNLHFKLFDDIEIDFSSFNIEFKQNSVLSSDIKGKIAINGLKDSTGQDAILDFTIDWTEDGYSIKVENSKGIQLKVPNVLDITLYSLSIGKINGKWEFKSKGKIDRVRDIPVIGSIIPRTIDFEKFNLNQGAANDYDIDIKWDNDVVAKIDENGLGLEHEETIHINKTFLKIFTLHLMKLKISTNAQNSSVDIQALIDADLELKPIFAKARGGGLKAEISFPEGGGNLGPVDIQFSFVTPTSMGVKIKIPGIEGQGYLDKDPVEEKYAGMLHLEIQKKLKITAIGILNMKLPSGKAGFSIIGIATVEFDPAIDITAGLKLSGIGALFGLNRSMDISALQSSLRNDTLQHLMFPEDAIKNAPTIISTMGSVFPVHEGQFTFGLLLKAYWGGEKLVQLKLGLLVEVPDPVKIAIAGILQLNLPDETNPLIKINAAFLAAVDFEAKKFALDARIFDSKIMNISISGDIVARYYWGANSGFLLSIGGFHPSYTPPQMDLPSKINRLALSFIDEPKRRLKGTFYMAVTSNSVQFGAALDLYVSIALGYNLKANFSLDVLIYTKPQFSFIAEMHISAGVYKGNKNKPAAGVSISMSLQGPNPYHVKGRGSVSIGPLDVSANFNFQIGKEKQIAASSVNVFVLLAAQLNNNYTWQAIMPDVNVNMREIDLSELDENSLLLHPMGSLQVKQGIVPLNIQIKCYGNSTIDGSDKLWIQNAKIGQTLLNIVPTKDKFAPNQFFNISDNQKLTSPSFNDYEDGIEIGGVDVIESSCVRTKGAGHDPIIIDREFNYPRPFETIDVTRQNDLLSGGFAAGSPIAGKNPNQHFIGQEEQVSSNQDGFVLLFAEDYSEVATELTFSTYDEAMNSLQVYAWDLDLFESEIIIEHKSFVVTS